MNSWRCSVHFWPTAVRNLIACEPLFRGEVYFAREAMKVADERRHDLL